VASNFEELHQIVELSMDVSTYRDRNSHGSNTGLFGKKFSGLGLTTL
jgi:hypothetical protein